MVRINYIYDSNDNTYKSNLMFLNGSLVCVIIYPTELSFSIVQFLKDDIDIIYNSTGSNLRSIKLNIRKKLKELGVILYDELKS